MTNTAISRLGTANTYDTARNNLMTRQVNLSNAQNQLTSGLRVNSASDDPLAAAQAERALTRIARIQTDQRALETQKSSITQAESTLGDVTDALQSFRDLVVTAGNGANTPSDLKSIASQLSGLRDRIFSLANSKSTNGQPLFGALASASTPFVGPQGAAPDYTFNGLPGQSTSSNVAIPLALDGASAFMLQPNRDGVYNVGVVQASATQTLTTNTVSVTSSAAVTGASYAIAITGVDTTTTPGTTVVSYNLTATPPGTVTAQVAPGYPSTQAATIAVTGMAGLALTIKGTPAVGDAITVAPNVSLFSTLDNAIRDIGGAANNNAVAQAINQAIGNIDTGIGRISAVRGQAGDFLNRADAISSSQGTRSIQLESDRSKAVDLDMVKGISDFQLQQTGYQAALQSYAQVQKLSLFNFIS
jgi:flagellar hook-associated protein 3 FlgL